MSITPQSELKTRQGKAPIWPSKWCSRCGGSGEHSYNQRDGTVCYGCSGSGLQVLNKEIGAIRAEYLEAYREATRPMAGDLEVGDLLAVYDGSRVSAYDGDRGSLACEGLSGRAPRNILWAPIVGLEITPGTAEKSMGSSSSGIVGQPGYTISYSGFVTIRYAFDDSEHVVNCSTANMWLRDRKVDRAPYLARAQAEADKAYAAEARREARREAKAAR